MFRSLGPSGGVRRKVPSIGPSGQSLPEDQSKERKQRTPQQANKSRYAREDEVAAEQRQPAVKTAQAMSRYGALKMGTAGGSRQGPQFPVPNQQSDGSGAAADIPHNQYMPERLPDQRDQCHCLDYLLGANETLVVDSTRASGPAQEAIASIEIMLGSLKSIISSFETVLGCQICHTDQDHLMIIASMSRQARKGIVRLMKSETSPAPSDGLREEQAQVESRYHAHDRVSDPGIEKPMTARGWRLDDDDEMQVIWNLALVRLTKLDRLLQNLEQMTDAKRLSCLSVLRAVRMGFVEDAALVELKLRRAA